MIDLRQRNVLTLGAPVRHTRELLEFAGIRAA